MHRGRKKSTKIDDLKVWRNKLRTFHLKTPKEFPVYDPQHRWGQRKYGGKPTRNGLNN
jgi:hypothetical protein